MKIRQDAWTEENDLLLAETVLRHVREGSTQLNAFEEVGDKLDRTSAACGFRWNAVVRHRYDKALALSRKQRKQRQRMLGIDQGGKKKVLYQPPALEDFETVTTELEQHLTEFGDESYPKNFVYEKTIENPVAAPNTLDLDTVIMFLQNYKRSNNSVAAFKSENERLKLEIKELQRQNKELEQKLNNIEKNSNSIQEDYETLIKIMNKARKLALIEEEERPATKFKMDRNGNLEKIAE